MSMSMSMSITVPWSKASDHFRTLDTIKITNMPMGHPDGVYRVLSVQENRIELELLDEG